MSGVLNLYFFGDLIESSDKDIMPTSKQNILYFKYSNNSYLNSFNISNNLICREKELFTKSINVFLCHSSEDKPVVRLLYNKLISNGMIPWLDEVNILPGQDWHLEIKKAIKRSDAVLVCISKNSITKRGYVQKEIMYTIDVASEQPESSIFLIPVRLENCIVPESLSRWQYVDLFDVNGYSRLLSSLNSLQLNNK